MTTHKGKQEIVFALFEGRAGSPTSIQALSPFRHAPTGNFLTYSTSEPVQTKLEIWAKGKKR